MYVCICNIWNVPLLVFVLFIYITGIMQLASFCFSSFTHHILKKSVLSHHSIALAHCSGSWVFLNECPLLCTLHSPSDGLELVSKCSDGHLCACSRKIVGQFTCHMSPRVRWLGQSVLILGPNYQSPPLMIPPIYTATNKTRTRFPHGFMGRWNHFFLHSSSSYRERQFLLFSPGEKCT